MSEKQAEINKVVSGTFEGQYLDAYGYHGRLRLDVEVKEDQLHGRYELILASEDKPQIISGQFEGKQERNAVIMRLALPKKNKGQEELEYNAELQQAGSYAKQCLFGLVRAPSASGLGGGVWIAWQFAERRSDKTSSCCG